MLPGRPAGVDRASPTRLLYCIVRTNSSIRFYELLALQCLAFSLFGWRAAGCSRRDTLSAADPPDAYVYVYNTVASRALHLLPPS